jgi:hypothetical protein
MPINTDQETGTTISLETRPKNGETLSATKMPRQKAMI